MEYSVKFIYLLVVHPNFYGFYHGNNVITTQFEDVIKLYQIPMKGK